MFFIGFDNQEIMLQEAETLAIRKVKKARTPALEEEKNKARKEQAAYLASHLIQSERKRAFKATSDC